MVLEADQQRLESIPLSSSNQLTATQAAAASQRTVLPSPLFSPWEEGPLRYPQADPAAAWRECFLSSEGVRAQAQCVAHTGPGTSAYVCPMPVHPPPPPSPCLLPLPPLPMQPWLLSSPLPHQEAADDELEPPLGLVAALEDRAYDGAIGAVGGFGGAAARAMARRAGGSVDLPVMAAAAAAAAANVAMALNVRPGVKAHEGEDEGMAREWAGVPAEAVLSHELGHAFAMEAFEERRQSSAALEQASAAAAAAAEAAAVEEAEDFTAAAATAGALARGYADLALRRAITVGALSPLRRALESHAPHASVGVRAEARRLRERLRYRAKRAAKHARRVNRDEGVNGDEGTGEGTGEGAIEGVGEGVGEDMELDAMEVDALSLATSRLDAAGTALAAALATGAARMEEVMDEEACEAASKAASKAIRTTAAQAAASAAAAAAAAAGAAAAAAAASATARDGSAPQVEAVAQAHQHGIAPAPSSSEPSTQPPQTPQGSSPSFSPQSPLNLPSITRQGASPVVFAPIAPAPASAAASGLGMLKSLNLPSISPGVLEYLTCPLTRTLMIDPVVTCEGRAYERSAITAWLRERRASPCTGALLATTELTPVHALRALAQQLGPAVVAAAAAAAAADAAAAHAAAADAAAAPAVAVETTTAAAAAAAMGAPSRGGSPIPEPVGGTCVRGRRVPTRRAARVSRDLSASVAVRRRPRVCISRDLVCISRATHRSWPGPKDPLGHEPSPVRLADDYPSLKMRYEVMTTL